MNKSKETLEKEIINLNAMVDALLYPKANDKIVRILVELERGFSKASKNEVCSSIKHENKIRHELIVQILKAVNDD